MPRCPCMDNMAKSFPFTICSPLRLRHKWTAKTHQYAHAGMTQHAFFYIWTNDIDECRLVRFRHVQSFWNKLNRFQSGCMVCSKCWIFGHMAFHSYRNSPMNNPAGTGEEIPLAFQGSQAERKTRSHCTASIRHSSSQRSEAAKSTHCAVQCLWGDIWSNRSSGVPVWSTWYCRFGVRKKRSWHTTSGSPTGAVTRSLLSGARGSQRRASKAPPT